MLKANSKFKKIILAIFIFIAICILSILTLITFGYIATPLDKSKLASTNLGVEIYNTTTDTTPIYYTSDK